MTDSEKMRWALDGRTVDDLVIEYTECLTTNGGHLLWVEGRTLLRDRMWITSRRMQMGGRMGISYDEWESMGGREMSRRVIRNRIARCIAAHLGDDPPEYPGHFFDLRDNPDGSLPEPIA